MPSRIPGQEGQFFDHQSPPEKRHDTTSRCRPRRRFRLRGRVFRGLHSASSATRASRPQREGCEVLELGRTRHARNDERRMSDVAVPIACDVAYPTGWLFYNDETDAGDPTLGSFVSGPGSPPHGVGSAQVSVSGTQRRNLATYAFAGTPLADITALKFTTYNPSAGNGGGRCVRRTSTSMPTYGSDTWQSRSSPPRRQRHRHAGHLAGMGCAGGRNANWRYSGSTWPVTGEPGATTKTWSQILSDYPGIRIRVTDAHVALRVGEPYATATRRTSTPSLSVRLRERRLGSLNPRAWRLTRTSARRVDGKVSSGWMAQASRTRGIASRIPERE